MQVVQKTTELTSEAGRSFVGKEYAKALELYDQAVKLVPEGSGEKAELCLKRAYCYLNLSK